jgi:hypothetical protein
MRNSLIKIGATVVAVSLAQRRRELSRLTIQVSSKPAEPDASVLAAFLEDQENPGASRRRGGTPASTTSRLSTE